MTSTYWQRNEQIAQLASERLQAQLDLNSPHRGLHQLSCLPQSSSCSILGLYPTGDPTGQLGAIEDCYVRGNDLIAVYTQDQDQSRRTQVYWRQRESAAEEDLAKSFSGVEMVVSVQTDLLDSLPELESESRLLAEEVILLEDLSGRSTKLLQEDTVLHAGQGPCCLVVRLKELPLSYVEMQPGLDFREMQIKISSHGESDKKVSLSHRLFPQRLEKGVILRARVCGQFVPRADDIRSAATLYEQLNLEELPLTT